MDQETKRALKEELGTIAWALGTSMTLSLIATIPCYLLDLSNMLDMLIGAVIGLFGTILGLWLRDMWYVLWTSRRSRKAVKDQAEES